MIKPAICEYCNEIKKKVVPRDLYCGHDLVTTVVLCFTCSIGKRDKELLAVLAGLKRVRKISLSSFVS